MINIKTILILKRERLKVEERIFKEIEEIFSSSSVIHKNFVEITQEDVNNVDLVITLGGDGTFIKAANMIKDAYILGINTNPESSEGALIDLTLKDLSLLKKIPKGEFSIINRQRISCFLNGKELPEHAINEVYIGSESAFFTSRYILHYKEKGEEQRSSGVIISTGSGSTAWYASAGGEPFEPYSEELRFRVREPYHGKRVFTPTLLFGTVKKGEKLKIVSKNDHREVVAINDTHYPFSRGSSVEISLSQKPLRCIVLK